MITAADIKDIIDHHYENCLEPLDEISKNTANNKSIIYSKTKFYNYDRIGEFVFKGKDKPKTPDMIFFKNDTVYFVEFKSGTIEGIKKKCEARGINDECQYVKWDIKLKALEGAFIVLHQLVIKHKGKIDFSHIFNLSKAYILVYKSNDQKGREKSKNKIIANHISNLPIKFGLHTFKNTFFRQVATYTPEFFISQMQKFKLIHEPEQ